MLWLLLRLLLSRIRHRPEDFASPLQQPQGPCWINSCIKPCWDSPTPAVWPSGCAVAFGGSSGPPSIWIIFLSVPVCRFTFLTLTSGIFGKGPSYVTAAAHSKVSSPGSGAWPPVSVSGSFLVRALRAPPISGIRAAPRSATAAPATRQI